MFFSKYFYPQNTPQKGQEVSKTLCTVHELKFFKLSMHQWFFTTIKENFLGTIKRGEIRKSSNFFFLC